MQSPRFMLSAPSSGSGKTMITCGILQALLERGRRPVAFKCGPDYIDPMFHARVLGTPSRNLDTFFTDEGMTRYLFARGAQEGDLSVMEGVMGYYDGLGGISTRGSAYDLARVTKTPVILIVDARGMSVSSLALLKGFLTYQSDSGIKGVIFNQTSQGMYRELAGMVKEELGIRPLGYVPRVPDMSIESRHLGLVLPGEVEDLKGKLKRLAAIFVETLDLDGILNLAGSAPDLSCERPGCLDLLYKDAGTDRIRAAAPVIAVAKDDAFCFIYEDNLKLLEDLGARIAYFSPLCDRSLPEGSQGLMLSGGYPELFAEQLEKNTSMRQEILRAIKSKMPVMAECGGFMYLHETMEDMEGRAFEGVGAVEGRAYYTGKLTRFGYIGLQANREGILGSGCLALKGHEFHYFDSTSCGESFTAKKPLRSRSWKCIHASDRTLMGFPHLYYHADPRLAADFLKECVKFAEESGGEVG